MPLNNFLRCIHVASIFPAFLWFYIWFHRGLLKSCAPHPMEARSTKQVHGAKKQRPSSETINLAVEKNFRGSRTNSCRSTKNIPTGSRKHIGKSPTFCVTLGPKKNLVRSKKHVQVKKRMPRSKKHASPSFIHLLIRPVQTSIQSYVLPNTHIICRDVASAASVDATWCCGGTGSECVALAA